MWVLLVCVCALLSEAVDVGSSRVCVCVCVCVCVLFSLRL